MRNSCIVVFCFVFLALCLETFRYSSMNYLNKLDWRCSCTPVWYFLTPRYGCPSASPSHSGHVCVWTRHRPAWRTSPPDGSPGWSFVCQPLHHASLLLPPSSAAENSVWRSPRPGPGSWELAFHRGGGSLLGLALQQSAWQHLDLRRIGINGAHCRCWFI